MSGTGLVKVDKAEVSKAIAKPVGPVFSDRPQPEDSEGLAKMAYLTVLQGLSKPVAEHGLRVGTLWLSSKEKESVESVEIIPLTTIPVIHVINPEDGNKWVETIFDMSDPRVPTLITEGDKPNAIKVRRLFCVVNNDFSAPVIVDFKKRAIQTYKQIFGAVNAGKLRWFDKKFKLGSQQIKTKKGHNYFMFSVVEDLGRTTDAEVGKAQELRDMIAGSAVVSQVDGEEVPF